LSLTLSSPATTEPSALSLHDALPICAPLFWLCPQASRKREPLQHQSLAVQAGLQGPVEQAHPLINHHEAQILSGNRTGAGPATIDRKSTRLNSSHVKISYAVFCLKKK